MKLCTKCNVPKSIKEFAIKKFPKRSSICKQCHRQYTKKHYENNKKTYVERAKKSNIAYRERARVHIIALKDKPCIDCGVRYPHYVMDFDHIEGKEENVADIVRRGGTIEDLDKEVAKCELVCSNCHRVRTWQRMAL